MAKEKEKNRIITVVFIWLSIALMFVGIISAIVHASSTAIYIDDYTNIQWDSDKVLTKTESEYPFDYTITATGTEDIMVYPDLSFTWIATGTGTETWYTFPYQNFIWTVTGTGTETWYEQMPNEGDPADYGFYQSGSAWYKDGKQVTQAGVSEFRVIGGKPFWKYGGRYYYNNMVSSSTLPGRWGHMGKVTQSGVTCFCVIDGKTFWKYGVTYYRNNLVGYDCPGWPCEVGWDGTWGHMGKVTQSGATEFVIHDDKPYWKLYSKCYYNTLVSYDCPGYPCNAGWDGTWSSIKEISCPLPSSGSIDPCAFGSNTATRTATDSGSSMVMKNDGNKFISTFSAMPQPQEGGTISDVTYSISDNNANVNTWISGNSVYASTTYSETHTATRTATDSGSGTVNKPEDDKDMGSFSAYPQPQQGGTISGITYSISDNNLDVDTWISGSHVYARTDYSEIQSKPWSDTETGISSVNDSEGDKYITTSNLIAPNDDTVWSVLDDSDYVETWMVVNKLYARAAILPVHNLNTGLDYSTIQTAIDAVETINGHTITVDPGTYTENVNVDKELTIKSTSGNPADTIIQAADSNDHVFEVIVDCVNISGFTLTGAVAGLPCYCAGIYVGGVDYCNITDNIASNNYYGIRLCSSNSNTIYNNYFSNTKNAYDDENNIWNTTPTSGTNIIGGPFIGGNYWSDYSGEDLDGDGLGDTLLPYNSNGNIINGGDFHPLIALSINNPPIAKFTFSPVTPLVGEAITFDASNSTDYDGTIVLYEWNFGDGNITNTTQQIIIHTYASACDYNVTLTVTDNKGANDTDIKTIIIISDGFPWVQFWGGSEDEYGNGIFITDGNVYVTGTTWSCGAGMSDALLLKYDLSGNELWNKTWGGLHYDHANRMYISDDNIYVAGSTHSFAYDPVGDLEGDAVILKYDLSGNLLWNTTWGNYPGYSGADSFNDVSVIGNDIYTVGFSEVNWGNRVLLLQKYNADNNLIWTRFWGPEGSGYPSGLCTAGHQLVILDNDIYVVGKTQSVVGAPYDAVLIKYDTSGNLIWEKTWGGSEHDFAYGVAVSDTGIYVAGHTNNPGVGGYDIFILKYDLAGNLLWNTTWGGSEDEFGYDLFISNNSIYITGSTRSFGAGGEDAFILKCDASGNPIWYETWGGISDDYAYSLFILENDIFITGMTTSFGAGNGDIFLLKISLICGDLDGDKTVTTDDLQLLLDYIFTGAPVNKYTADVDKNGRVNILDARLLMNHIADNAGYPLNCTC